MCLVSFLLRKVFIVDYRVCCLNRFCKPYFISLDVASSRDCFVLAGR